MIRDLKPEKKGMTLGDLFGFGSLKYLHDKKEENDMFGLFGDLFDFNHDGKLDGFERAAEFATFASMLEESERDRSCRDDGFGEGKYADHYDDDY